MSWSLERKSGEFLEPLTFSNNKSQEDVVQELLGKIKEGHQVIFLRGVCGSGKSSVALNLAKELGKASIVVPVKYLQTQYEEDYMDKLVVKKDDGSPLKITILTGRNNHKCLYNTACKADDKFLPCHIKIKKENMDLLKLYAKENPFVDEKDIESLEDVRRMTVAPACRYWSPIMNKDWANKALTDAEVYEYKGLNDKRYLYHKREPGCTYYGQFMSYINSDVMVFNAKKYELESVMDRKPATEVEIIDECDEFLDSLGNERTINFGFFLKLLEDLGNEAKGDMKELLGEIHELVRSLVNAKWLDEMIENKEILKIQETKVHQLLTMFLNNDHLTEYEELEPFYNIAKSFEGLFNSTYINFYRTPNNNVVVRIVNINLERKLKELVAKNKVFVMMSGTIHSRQVLEDIFGITDFVIVDAETELPGTIKKVKTNLERNFRYREFKEGRVSREEYLRALQACVDIAEKPFLVHVNSFTDLPSEQEKKEYGLSMISRERFEEQQERYKAGELLQRFKAKELEILYSTRCTRGVDLPGDTCKSIIFTKYPFPSMDSLFWKLLREEYPEKFMEFYFDKSQREFLQRIYRGLRSKDDTINVLSPDSKVLSSIA